MVESSLGLSARKMSPSSTMCRYSGTEDIYCNDAVVGERERGGRGEEMHQPHRGRNVGDERGGVTMGGVSVERSDPFTPQKSPICSSPPTDSGCFCVG